MRYLVTGATGFVGSHIVDRLRDRGDAVRALVRQPRAAEDLRKRGVEVWSGDLSTAADLRAAVDGVDVVIHGAGVVDATALPRNVWEVNLGGTERLLAASAQVGLARFVHLSSIAVYGYVPPPVAEDAPKRPVGPYGESKWAAEQALWRYHADHRLPAVALRPCIIYGERDHLFLPRLLRICRMRAVPLPHGGRRILDLVYVSDVVDAALAAAVKDTAVGRSYNITDGEAYTYRDILLAYGQLTGRRPAILPFPGRAVVLALQMTLRLMQVSRIPEHWMSPLVGLRMGLRILGLDLHYAIDAARRDLGYAPRVGLMEGLHCALAWRLGQESGSGKQSEPARR
jgi:nucleoside-diphosphate-sugar epimerase